MVSSHGLPFINIVCEALWTVDGDHAVLNSRSCAVPPMLSKFQGYNCLEQHRHVKASLNSLIFDSLSKQLLYNNNLQQKVTVVVLLLQMYWLVYMFD